MMSSLCVTQTYPSPVSFSQEVSTKIFHTYSLLYSLRPNRKPMLDPGDISPHSPHFSLFFSHLPVPRLLSPPLPHWWVQRPWGKQLEKVGRVLSASYYCILSEWTQQSTYPQLVCLTAYINTPVPVKITGAFPIMSLLGKREEGVTF